MFACCRAMLEHMRRLEVHCRALWARRLTKLGRGRQEAFLNDYLPRLLGARAPPRPFQPARQQRPRCLPPQARPLARPAGAPPGTRTRFGHRGRIVPCAQSGDVRGVRGNRSTH